MATLIHKTKLAENAVGAEGAANGQKDLRWPFSMASFLTRGVTVVFSSV